MFGLFRRSSSDRIIARLHDSLMRGALQPAFYATLGASDTLEGRFELTALHGALLIRRLGKAEPPGPDVARDLTDAIFEGFDIALRETGVGDIAVPKRMKKLAQDYLGRVNAYSVGLDNASDEVLTAAVARNVLGEETPEAAPTAPAIVAYIRAAEARLAATGLPDLLANGVDWPPVDGGFAA